MPIAQYSVPSIAYLRWSLVIVTSMAIVDVGVDVGDGYSDLPIMRLAYSKNGSFWSTDHVFFLTGKNR